MNGGAGRAVLAGISEEFGRVFASLEPIRDRFAARVAAGPPVRERLAVLQPEIFDLLDRHRGLVAGAGVVTAPGLLDDAPYWLEWWFSPSSGEPGRLRVNLDPSSPDFFDYTLDDWFTTPRDTAAPHISGPNVDYACTGQYAITIALPVNVGGTFAGIAGADVLVSSLEERVLPRLCQLSRSCVLVTGNGRVVVSASPDYAPGLRADPARAQRITLPSLDWQLLVVPSGS